MGRRPKPGADLQAVRAALGTALRSIHSGVLNEPLPERIAELLRRLDQQLRALNVSKDDDDM
jgi:Anti-sigma factor NepR